MSATYCRFTLIGRVLTVPKVIKYIKHTSGQEEELCCFIVGVAPKNRESVTKTENLGCFNIESFGGVGRTAFNNISVHDYVFIEGTPRSVKKNYGKDLSKSMFYSSFVADKIILLNRKIKTAWAKNGVSQISKKKEEET